jgi:NADH dehydrogenase FAD-containing subunit
MFQTRLEAVEEGSIVVSTAGVQRRIEPVDQVILAVGVTPRQDLKDLLQARNIRHVIVGDALEPRRIVEATTEGARAAWEI